MNSNIIKKVTTQKTSWALKEIFVKNYFFIFFIFINLFLPIFMTIISSQLGPNGGLNVIMVGLSSGFISIFNELSISLVIVVVFLLIKKKKKMVEIKEISGKTFYFIALIGLMNAILFVAGAIVYVEFSTIYSNIHSNNLNVHNFIYTTGVSLFLNIFIYGFLISIMKEKGNLKATIFLLITFFVNLIIIPLFTILPNWNDNFQLTSLGISMIIASLVNLIILVIYNIFGKFVELSNFRTSLSEFKYILSKMFLFSINTLMMTLVKTILVLLIGISLSLNHEAVLPNLMVGKIIWYHIMFFSGFFYSGVLLAIKFININRSEEKLNTSQHFSNILTIICISVTLVTLLAFFFLIKPLASLYASNQKIALYNPITEKNELLNADIISSYFLTIDIKNINPDIKNQVNFSLSFVYLIIAIISIDSSKTLKAKITKHVSYQKIKLKKIIISFSIIGAVIAVVWGFSLLSKHTTTFKESFSGLDAYSFPLMLVGLTALTFDSSKLIIKHKKANSHIQK